MSKPFKINEELSIYVVTDVVDSLLTNTFFSNLYNNVFSDETNNLKAGLTGMNSTDEVQQQIKNWLKEPFTYMFFLFKGKDVVGTTQTFKSWRYTGALTLGYTVSPLHQGKGYGTIMLKFVTDHLIKVGFDEILLGFRDGNVASERIAAKNNYTYHSRTNVPDASGVNRPMTYYKYNGKNTINESYSVIPQKKVLTTNQWIEDSDKILSRVNPKIISFNEYVYLSTSTNKPISLNETYFVFTSAHHELTDRLRKERIKSISFGMTDRISKNLFDPTTKGDIILDEFYNLVESDLKILEVNRDKTSMILGNDIGEVKIKIIDNIMLIEDFVLNK